MIGGLGRTGTYLTPSSSKKGSRTALSSSRESRSPAAGQSVPPHTECLSRKFIFPKQPCTKSGEEQTLGFSITFRQWEYDKTPSLRNKQKGKYRSLNKNKDIRHVIYLYTPSEETFASLPSPANFWQWISHHQCCLFPSCPLPLWR